MFYIFIIFLLIKNKYKFLLTSFFNQAGILDLANKVIFFLFFKIVTSIANFKFTNIKLFSITVT